jgi:hypothetical protein
MLVSYGEELLGPKLEGHPLSAVRDDSISMFAATSHILNKYDVRVWSGCIWLRVWSGGGLL